MSNWNGSARNEGDRVLTDYAYEVAQEALYRISDVGEINPDSVSMQALMEGSLLSKRMYFEECVAEIISEKLEEADQIAPVREGFAPMHKAFISGLEATSTAAALEARQQIYEADLRKRGFTLNKRGALLIEHEADCD